ncbi:Kinesin-like protein kif19 [Entophlyctis luteolus]|nr:Kinesin-like protein kif19 [Entophlyctis luteolus]
MIPAKAVTNILVVLGRVVSKVNKDQVAVRVRPALKDHKQDEVIKPTSRTTLTVTDFSDAQDVLRQDRPREKSFEFDSVYPDSSSQKDVFEGTTKELINYVLQGFNATVFAYGATGAGKTYTMIGTTENPGVVPQTLEHLFLQIDKETTAAQENKTSDSSVPSALSYRVHMSYLEIYNENIRDLLSGRSEYLELWEDKVRGSVVGGIERIETKSATEVLEWLEKGNLNRTQEATCANEVSSRSHAILQVFVARRIRVKRGHYTEQNGKLSMIDLAGSERAADTKNKGMRMLEGASINRSLLALGNCINALSEDGANGKYVNYRDSKLTRLLKDSLGGNCKTVMIANISPTVANLEETLNTLKYASRARAIKSKVARLTPTPVPKPISLPNIALKSRLSVLSSPKTSSEVANLPIKPLPPKHMRRPEESSIAKQYTAARFYEDRPGNRKLDTPASSMLGELENCLLESFAAHKELQKGLNSVEFKLQRVGEKIAVTKSVSTQGTTLFEASATKLDKSVLSNLITKIRKLQDTKSKISKRIRELDERIRTLIQTIPKSLDRLSQRYLDVRTQAHFSEMDGEGNLHSLQTDRKSALKREGIQAILANKIKIRNLEAEIFSKQLAILQNIAVTQREILDKQNLVIPEGLLEQYSIFKNTCSKGGPIGDNDENSEDSWDGNAMRSLALDDWVSDSLVDIHKQKQASTQNSKTAIIAYKGQSVSMPAIIQRQISDSIDSTADSSFSSSEATDATTSSQAELDQNTYANTFMTVTDRKENNFESDPFKKADVDDTDAEYSSITTLVEATQQRSYSSNDEPKKIGKKSKTVIPPTTVKSNAVTIKEARAQIQDQIREARAERQKMRVNQDAEFGQNSRDPPQRVKSGGPRKVKVIAGKGIIS